MSEYINRESIRKVLMDVCSDENCPMFIAATIDQVIDYEPAADVAPVVHGRWIRFKEPDSETGYIHMRCSVCTAYWSDPSHADHFRYCPSCGAKMDGGGKAKAKEEKEEEMDACRLTKKLS